MEHQEGNLNTFEEIYNKTPITAADFLAIILKPPPSCIKTDVYRFLDRETSTPIGWAVMYLHSWDTASKTSLQSAVFTPLNIRGAFERNMEVVYPLCRFTIEHLNYEVLDARTVSNVEFSHSSTNYGFDFVQIFRRQVLLEKTEASNIYRVTKENWPLWQQVAGAYLGIQDEETAPRSGTPWTLANIGAGC